MSQNDLTFALALADRADAMTLARFGALDLRVDTKPDLTPVTEPIGRSSPNCAPSSAAAGPATVCSAKSSTGQQLSADGSGSSTRSMAPRTWCAAYRYGPA
jgi:hypothetical protein